MTRSDDSPKPDPDPPQSFAARLRQKYGEGVDPEVSLGGEPSDAPSGATEELLKRIAEHGVNSPRYTLEGEIARGGMGAILRVWDEELRRHLAMKVVLGQGEGGAPSAEAGGKGATPKVDARGRVETPRLDAKVLARFLEEAQVTSQLDHPGIVPVHELGLDADGRVYFTMKLVKGRDLKHVFDLVFEGKEGWNETRALGVILKACEAMAYAHKKGVIHRDLKPANVMVGSYGEVFVMDWGLARVLGRRDTHDIRIEAEGAGTPGSLLTSVKTERREEREEAPDSPLVTMDGDVMGTPAYMPPEQARGEIEKLSQRSDVYSIGAMLYHLLAKQIPFVPPGTRMTNRTVLARVLEGPPKSLHEINKAVPAELVAICEKAMTRDAAGRYADTLALAEDLRAYLEHRVVAAYETGSVAELKKWIKRNKPLAAAMAGAAAILVAGVVTSMNFAGRASEKAAEAEKARTETAEKNTELEGINQLLAVAKQAAEQNEESAKQQSYVANIIAADANLRANEVAEAGRRLDACEESLRGWEWRYLHLAMPASLAVLEGHEGPLTSVVFSSDGSRIASGSQDNTVRVWNAISGENMLTLRGQDHGVWSVAFSPDGSRIASASGDKTVRVWNASSGENLLTLRGHDGYVTSVAISPDGSRIASASDDRTVRVWNASSGEILLVLRGYGNGVLAVAFSPDGSRIASASLDGTIRIWNATSGESLLILLGHEAQVFSISFSPDGSRIASGSADGTARVWNASSGENLLTLHGQGMWVDSVAFSPDGSRIASGSMESVRVSNATSGETLLELPRHFKTVNSIAFSPDGSRIVTGCGDNMIRVWSATGIENVLTLRGHDGEVASVAFSPDGSRIATGSSDNTVRVWNADNGENLLTFHGHDSRVTSVAFSPDGSHIASASSDQTVRVWKASSGETLRVLGGQHGEVYTVAFSPDGSRIASASFDFSTQVSTVTAWSSISEQLQVFPQDRGLFIQSIAFSPDGSRIALPSGINTVDLWSATTGASLLTLRGHDDRVNSVAFSPDGSRVASGSADNTIRVWNASSGESLLTLRGHESGLASVAFSPDGSRIASGAGDKTVRVWNARSGEGLLVLRGHEGIVRTVAFSPDGSRIASASDDKTVRVWETSAAAVQDPSRRVVTEAALLVHSLFDRGTLVKDVIEKLRTNTSLHEDVRSVAIRLAHVHGDDPARLDSANRDIVLPPQGERAAYMRALRIAEVVCGMQPDNASYLNTLGVAQYRVGQYESALESLARSDELNHGERPSAVAFLAMTQYQLGNKEAARVALTQLRERISDPRWKGNADVESFLQEAETLIAGPPSSKPGEK